MLAAYTLYFHPQGGGGVKKPELGLVSGPDVQWVWLGREKEKDVW